MTTKCEFPGCKATHPEQFSHPRDGWAWVEDADLTSGWYCPAHADAYEAEQQLGQCEWCGVEPATIDLGKGGRLCHECHVADDDEWKARRGTNTL